MLQIQWHAFQLIINVEKKVEPIANHDACLNILKKAILLVTQTAMQCLHTYTYFLMCDVSCIVLPTSLFSLIFTGKTVDSGCCAHKYITLHELPRCPAKITRLEENSPSYNQKQIQTVCVCVCVC